MRVIITCSILEGDQPIKLFWLFDGQPIDFVYLDVEEISMGDMGSSLLFRRVDQKHNGLYTCLAKNSAGNTTHSAKMIVKGIIFFSFITIIMQNALVLSKLLLSFPFLCFCFES
jgi:hypothetical protein